MAMGGTMNSCGQCMKISLVITNVAIFIGGVLVLGVGAWVWGARSFLTSLLSSNIFVASMSVVVAMGAAMVLLSIFGCCAAAKEVKCMLLTYYILIFIIFVVMLIGGILQFVFREKVVSSLERDLYAMIPVYGRRHEVTKAWDDTQTYLECCGVKSYSDWNGNYPESCCKEIYPGKRLECQSSADPSNMYTNGCIEKTREYMRENAVFMGVVAVITSVIMILALIFSCGLFVKIE